MVFNGNIQKGEIMKKDIAIVLLYHMLKNGDSFQIKDVMNLTGTSERTSNRYIADLKQYFQKYENDYILRYSAEKKSFTLKKNSNNVS